VATSTRTIHWYYDLAPKINQSAWEFLAKYELSSAQRYSDYRNGKDTSRANGLIPEIDGLRQKAYDLWQEAETTDAQVRQRDLDRERDEIKRLAHEELDLLNQSAALRLAAADKADSAKQLKLSDNNRQYLSLIAQHNRKKWGDCKDTSSASRGAAQ
jgi:hypothetical protein